MRVIIAVRRTMAQIAEHAAGIARDQDESVNIAAIELTPHCVDDTSFIKSSDRPIAVMLVLDLALMNLDIPIGQRQAEFNSFTLTAEWFPSDARGLSVQNAQGQRHDPEPLKLIPEFVTATAEFL